MKLKPQKRHKALHSLSREHHHGLLLSWKIRSGFSKNIAISRIQTYTNWFFKTYLIPHFELEERYIFSVLGADNEFVKKALEDHQYIKFLFLEAETSVKKLSNIEQELEQHIRFEERILFPEIQKIATEAQLLYIEKNHQSKDFIDNLEDEFWR